MSAIRAEIERRAVHRQGDAFPLERDLGADGAARARTGRGETEEACPLSHPLVKSFRTVLPVHWPRSCGMHTEKTSHSFSKVVKSCKCALCQ